MNRYEKIMKELYRGLVVLQTFLLGTLLAIVSVQIIIRILPFLPNILWTEEIARFLLVWVIFLGAAIGVKEGTHFTVSILPEAKSKLVSWIWELAILIAMTSLSAIFTYRGIKYAKVMIWDISNIAQISMIWVGAAIPAFGILSLLFIVEMFVKQFKKEGL
ncbi:MAG: TRAP transporter small permease subunit [Spirochaetaceae bacterium]|jgi:TRAP-type C4-dicarboxylate transport system permease small subunit|nr:TRAP transporter small permease subunit [Spirochaetaceae bacterium]